MIFEARIPGPFSLYLRPVRMIFSTSVMKMETYEEHFNELVALISRYNAAAFKTDERVSDAVNDLSQALGLTHQAAALLVWSMSNMSGKVVELSHVASQIGYSGKAVSSSLDELERRNYMVKVDDYDDCLDVTSETKALIINRYCFYKLLHN